MPALLERENMVDQQAQEIPIERGDVVLILKPDGSFKVFNTHEGLTLETMTDEMKEQGRRLLGLTAALRLPRLMDICCEVGCDPDVFEETLDTGLKH
jgi:hypothetical protein